MIEAPTFQRIMHLSGAVGGQDHDRRLRCRNRAHLGDRDLEIAQRLQKKGLEWRIGAVQLVDQQHRRAAICRAHRFQQGAFDEEFIREQLGAQSIGLARRLCCADRHHLGGEVPLVDGGIGVQPLVALQPDQLAPQPRRQCLGDLGLADTGLPFQEDRPPQPQGQEHHGGKVATADVTLFGQHPLDRINARSIAHAPPFRPHQGASETGRVKATFGQFVTRTDGPAPKC